MRTRTASCACGQLSLTTSGEPQHVAICSCRLCQRRTGSSFSAHAFFPADAVTVCGQHRSFRRGSDSGRQVTFEFCPTCGSTLFWLAEARPASLGIALGAFADPEFPAPHQAIWSESKVEWVTLPPDIADHPRGTPQR